VKKEVPFTVVMGNPPYSISSQNAGPWIVQLMDSYKGAVRHEKNIQPLSDDYVKFFRVAQYFIEKADVGVLSYISNHTYLSGLIHRGMRQSLLSGLDSIHVLDLNGSALLGLQSPQGQVDQNVFDIQQGVAILAGLRYPNRKVDRQNLEVHFLSLFGARRDKYDFLLSRDLVRAGTTNIRPRQPNYFFVPTQERDQHYDAWPNLAEVFQVHSTGFETGRDEVLIAFDEDDLHAFARDLHSTQVSDRALWGEYSIRDTSGWPVTSRRTELQGMSFGSLWDSVRKVQYRPFDRRFTIYCPFLRRAQYENMRHMLVGNI
jgi:predicted helicase